MPGCCLVESAEGESVKGSAFDTFAFCAFNALMRCLTFKGSSASAAGGRAAAAAAAAAGAATTTATTGAGGGSGGQCGGSGAAAGGCGAAAGLTSAGNSANGKEAKSSSSLIASLHHLGQNGYGLGPKWLRNIYLCV